MSSPRFLAIILALVDQASIDPEFIDFVRVYDLDEEGDGGMSIKCVPSSMRGRGSANYTKASRNALLPQSG